jgi:hypothetical protein
LAHILSCRELGIYGVGGIDSDTRELRRYLVKTIY